MVVLVEVEVASAATTMLQGEKGVISLRESFLFMWGHSIAAGGVVFSLSTVWGYFSTRIMTEQDRTFLYVPMGHFVGGRHFSALALAVSQNYVNQVFLIVE